MNQKKISLPILQAVCIPAAYSSDSSFLSIRKIALEDQSPPSTIPLVSSRFKIDKTESSGNNRNNEIPREGTARNIPGFVEKSTPIPCWIAGHSSDTISVFKMSPSFSEDVDRNGFIHYQILVDESKKSISVQCKGLDGKKVVSSLDVAIQESKAQEILSKINFISLGCWVHEVSIEDLKIW